VEALDKCFVFTSGSRLGRTRTRKGLVGVVWLGGVRRALSGASIPRDYLVSNDLHSLECDHTRAATARKKDDISRKAKINNQSNCKERDRAYISIEVRTVIGMPRSSETVTSRFSR
jgi:hypothetical protein